MSAADFRRFRLSHLRAALRARKAAREAWRPEDGRAVWAGWAFAEAAQARYWREHERYQRRLCGGAA